MKIRSKLDEFGLIKSDELDFKFYGGGKGGGASQPIYIPQPSPAAVSTPPPAPVSEAATQDTAATPEEEAPKK